jgi:hypothetical protein
MLWILQTYDNEIRQIRQRDKLGELQFIEYNPEAFKDTMFDIEVVAGVETPTGRVAKEEAAVEKFKEGIYGIEDVMKNSADPDKQDVIENFYRREGLETLMQKQEAINKAFNQFESLVDKAIRQYDARETNGEVWIDSLEEEQMAELIKEFPELMNTGEWEHVPTEYQNRILEVFKIKPESLQEAVAM